MRLRYLALIAAVLALIGGYTAYWFRAASAAERAFAGWSQRLALAGHQLDAAPEIGGYPFRLIARLEDPRLTLRSGGSITVWRPGALRIIAQPWNLRHIIVLFDAAQTVELRDADTGIGLARALTLRARPARASLVFARDGRLERLAVDLENVEIETPTLTGGAPGIPLRAARARFRLISAADATLGRRFSERDAARTDEAPDFAPLTWVAAWRFETISLGAAPAPGLQSDIALIEGEAGVHGTPPDLGSVGLGAWGAAGGGIEITGFRLDWGDLHITASGPLTIDASGYPAAALDARIIEYERLIDGANGAGLIADSAALAARMLIALIPRDSEDGSVPVPVIARGGLLFLGPVPVANLPVIAAPRSTP